jgi:hypothetical protein
MANHFMEISVASWDKLIRQYKDTKPGEYRWAFRGHSSDGWELKPTLERTFERIHNFNRKNDAKITEHQIFREFIRRAHHYSFQHTPRKNDVIEWLALMQHYGAPTRLLDCTYSFFVGLHFAVENVALNDECALWLIHVDWLREKFVRLLPKAIREEFKDGKNPEVINDVFKDDNYPGITWVNSLRLNERQVTQQGLFIIQGVISETFENNLLSITSKNELRKHIKKLVIKATPTFIRKIQKELACMNISEASLFPGLDGFARSLRIFAQRKFIKPFADRNATIFSSIENLGL